MWGSANGRPKVIIWRTTALGVSYGVGMLTQLSLPSPPDAAPAAIAATASPAASAAAWLCEAGAAIEMEGHPYGAHRRGTRPR